MKKYVFILLLTVISITASAQKGKEKEKGNEKTEKPIDYKKNVATVDDVIKTFYSVVSGEKGEKRDWKLFKFLFYPDAKLITAGKNNDREFLVKFMGSADYIKSSEKWMLSNGFIENEISRKTEIFGRMAHVFSTYETFNSKEEEEPNMRGINSIQLLNDGSRWWILNIYWTKEAWYNPIPSKYLD
ncbi:hypothetical protein [Algibacter sp. L4_22]|uniref:hypothetical protein n=1 Tax=Algibacter sp. L4_22 TaxID=2942477 RepID=UPI00201B5F14|nr:hypothetical protein [Algibacter sp. L4_22]MCL5128094.1 hypothetical protein [Algibacter sp. L4_22]